MGLTNTQYNEIMRDYYRQQLKNQQELSERRQEIYQRFPEFHELDRRIASESCACARALLLEGTASQDSRVRMENRLFAAGRLDRIHMGREQDRAAVKPTLDAAEKISRIPAYRLCAAILLKYYAKLAVQALETVGHLSLVIARRIDFDKFRKRAGDPIPVDFHHLSPSFLF